jgi:hypothetical protein
MPVNPLDSVVEMQQNSTSAAVEVAVETLLNSSNCISVVNTDGATVGYEVPQSDCSAIHIALNSEGQICGANVLSGPHWEQFICLVPADRLDCEVNDEATEDQLRAVDVADASNSQDANMLNSVPTEVSNLPKRRRGIRNISLWKQNIRKRNRQSGKSYINSKGGMERARSVQQRRSCVQCKFKCTAKITEDMKSEIHSSFWSMSDELKFSLYEQTTQRVEAKRTASEFSRRKYAFKYYLNVDSQKIRVCKNFYLSCLDISQRRVSYYHQHIRNQRSGMFRQDMRGRHPKKTTSSVGSWTCGRTHSIISSGSGTLQTIRNL